MAFRFINNGKIRVIEEIIDTEGKTYLGTAKGNDLGHCIYLGMRHCKTTKDFLTDVKYYSILNRKESDPRFNVSVEFYK